VEEISMKPCVPKWRFAAVLLLSLAEANLARAADTQLVAMRDIFTDPPAFEGRKVRVAGFLGLDADGKALYMNRDDFNRSAAGHALRLDLTNAQLRSLSKLNNGRVLVEGTFSTNTNVDGTRWPGALKQVVRIRMWRNPRRK
jgi:hypothetical protein